MYLVTVFWLAADGLFDPTILGLFAEEDFVRWRCAMGYFSNFPSQTVPELVSTGASPSSGMPGKKNPVK